MYSYIQNFIIICIMWRSVLMCYYYCMITILAHAMFISRYKEFKPLDTIGEASVT